MQQPKINLTTATLIGINSMIGAGIFTAPAKLALFVGPAGIVTYVFIILSVWCMAFSFARLTQLIPEEGSFYAYARSWGGHSIGLFFGASYLLGIAIAMGLITKLAGIYAHQYQLLNNYSPTTIGLVILTVLTSLNVAGGFALKATQYISIACTSIPLTLITLMCLTKARLANLVPFAPYGFGNVFRATGAIIFGFLGFESTMSLSGVVERPSYTVPRALSGSMIFVSIVYLAFIVSVLLAIPATHFTALTTPLSEPLHTLFPAQPWLTDLIHFTILASFISVVNAMIWATSSMMHSLLRNVASVQPLIRRGFITQRVTVLGMGAVIGVSALIFNNIDLFFSLTALFVVFAYASALVALLAHWSQLTTAERLRAVIGTGTAILIIYYAVEGLML